MPLSLKTEINAVNFLHELSHLEFEGVTAKLSLTLTHEGTPFFSASYKGNASGCVTIYDVDRLIEAELDRAGVATCSDFGIMANGASVGRASFKVFRCAVMTAVPAATLLDQQFLTLGADVRYTQIDRDEVLWIYAAGDTAVSAECVFVSAEGSITRSTVSIGTVSGLRQLNVSPRLFAGDPLGPTLVSYMIKAGDRETEFRVRDIDRGLGMLFANAFGCLEVLWLGGTVETKSDINRSTGMSRGSMICYAVDETMTRKAWSGPMAAPDCPLGCDLARSRYVWLYEGAGKTRPVIITDADTDHSDAIDRLFEFSYTFRLADRRTAMAATLSAYQGVFDENYDKKFD